MTNTEIKLNADLADTIIDDIETAIRRAAMLFTVELMRGHLKLRDAVEPLSMRQARGTILACGSYAEAMTADGADGEINVSKRKVQVARLFHSYALACVAEAYVDYWRDEPGYKNFQVLGHQALAYAGAVKGDNWEFFAPPLFFRPHEPLLAESESNLNYLERYAQAALGFAQALHGQMMVLPKRERRVPFEPVLLTDEEKQQMTPIFITVKIADAELQERFTQERLLELHREDTRDWLMRESAYGRPVHRSTNPMQRMAGFTRKRGGKKN